MQRVNGIHVSGQRVKKLWSHLRDTHTLYRREDSKASSHGPVSKRGKLESGFSVTHVSRDI